MLGSLLSHFEGEGADELGVLDLRALLLRLSLSLSFSADPSSSLESESVRCKLRRKGGSWEEGGEGGRGCSLTPVLSLCAEEQKFAPTSASTGAAVERFFGAAALHLSSK